MVAVHWCLRLSPLVALTLILLHGKSLVELIFGGADPGTALSLVLLPGAGVVSQFFAWVFVVIGLGLLWALVSFVVAEVRLSREIDRDNREHLVRLPPESRRAWRR